MTIARALWTIAPGVAELRAETLPARAPDQVLARMLASGISRGTERLVLAGKVPENQHGVMRCPLQAGDFPPPCACPSRMRCRTPALFSAPIWKPR